jgi:hypothetical protein
MKKKTTNQFKKRKVNSFKKPFFPERMKKKQSA